jgi:SAM-dependent methyltransferase
MDIEQLHEANRTGWNEGAAHYAGVVEQDIAFLREGGKNFVAPEYEFLADLSDWCSRAIHLQCAGGRDTLSLWNQGAREVVGVDISDVMIDCARRKSEALGAPATWYRCDVLDTPAELDGTADLVYTGRGALNWIMDIDAWARVPARLLKPGGRLYIFEGHPIMWIWDPEATELKLDPEFGDYFDRQVHRGQGWPDQYIGELDRPREELALKCERQWTLGDVVNACVSAGLRVERLEEHPDSYWDELPNVPPDILRRIPNTYSLLLRKGSASD